MGQVLFNRMNRMSYLLADHPLHSTLEGWPTKPEFLCLMWLRSNRRLDIFRSSKKKFSPMKKKFRCLGPILFFDQVIFGFISFLLSMKIRLEWFFFLLFFCWSSRKQWCLVKHTDIQKQSWWVALTLETQQASSSLWRRGPALEREFDMLDFNSLGNCQPTMARAWTLLGLIR